MRVLATYSIKGGVGKTSAAVNLAALAADEGRRTLVWDLDPQGASSYLFRVKPKVKGGGRKLVRGRRDVHDVLKGTDIEGLDLLPADFSYRYLDLVLDDTKRPERGLARVLAPLAGDYDLAVVDCPPSISLVSESVFAVADLLLVPLIPSTLSVRTVEQLHAFLDGQSGYTPAVLAFFSMVDRRKRLHREVMEALAAAAPAVADSAIPSASLVERMGLHRSPVVQTDPRSAPALAYQALWREVDRTLAGLPART
jgi:chromosome partitioning protein